MNVNIIIAALFFTTLIACNDKTTTVKDIIANPKQSNQLNHSESTKTKKESILFEYDNEVSELGIGLILAPPQFSIFNDSLLNDKLISHDMYEDAMTIYAKYSKPDYGIMHFVCTEINESYYTVIVNSSLTKYMARNGAAKYVSWKDYIIESLGIRRKTKNQLKMNPNNESEEIEIPEGLEMFCPLEFDGNWIRAKWDCFYNDESSNFEGEPCIKFIDKCKQSKTGWIKWKEENKVLIDIFQII